ncbi:SulP family inorganic anion transporter [Actinophytocola gossypii]|uniref:Bifunctional SulP family inorganic anion transporter/carbonic anhydrase n=1 Tax=Actinophytocola gossypii TaxID=2812003 RepID=A0ABT2J1J2_9PSEU|nr:SulP family inorganic anion transporter [Actinophytocola gossypii]MCT2581728.1 bifunctional SulP family inorganic anion transporter/carbonic anhydrase [Actinophytocola gossypii]
MIETRSGNEHGPPGRWRTTLRYDLPASLVVFLVAVPLSIGIAFASGAPVVAGLTAAVVGGVVAGLCGGSILQVSGPAAGLTVIVAETIDTFGWATTCAITVLAGAAQVLLGLSRIARAALAISPAVVHGMLAGIGVTIALAQLHVVLGGATQHSPVANLLELPGQVVDASGPATLVGVLTVVIMVCWGRLPAAVRRVPGPLAAVVGMTVLSVVTGMTIDRVELPENVLNLDFAPVLPDGGWGAFALAVFTIALVASVESLLSAVAVDKLHTGPRANLNRELVGQGMANMASGSLGGLPVTGVIVRSSTNVASGARTRASAVLHGLWVFVFVVLLAGVLRHIPLAALAGLLVYVGARLVDVGRAKQVLRHGDLPVYLVTLLGVVGLGLLDGVLLGIGLAAALTLRRLLWAGIHAERDGDDWRIVVEGALASLSIPRLTTVLGGVPRGSTVTLELVVDFMDHAAFDTLSAWQHAHERTGGTVIVNEIGHPWFARGKAGEPTVHRAAAQRALPRWFAPWSEWQCDPERPDEPAPEPSAEGVVPAQRAEPGPILRGTAEYARRTAHLVEPTLRRLADRHTPDSLLLTCGDARIVPNVITASGPGDLFTVRNIGNLVPGDREGSVAAALEYAVGRLRVREVAVCGHSSCGAMKALVRGVPAGAPALRSWLRHAAPTLRRAGEMPPLTVDGREPEAEWDRLALHNVLAQLDRLRTSPVVAAALARGELTLVGMYFDLTEARMHVYDPRSGGFRAAGSPEPQPSRVSG